MFKKSLVQNGDPNLIKRCPRNSKISWDVSHCKLRYIHTLSPFSLPAVLMSAPSILLMYNGNQSPILSLSILIDFQMCDYVLVRASQEIVPKNGGAARHARACADNGGGGVRVMEGIN